MIQRLPPSQIKMRPRPSSSSNTYVSVITAGRQSPCHELVCVLHPVSVDPRAIMMKRTYTNPVHEAYLADPYAWRHDSLYFVIGTGATEAAGPVATSPSKQPTIFPVLRSRDLVRWREIGHALVRPDPSFGDTFWAPEIVRTDGGWLLYYSVGWQDRLHQIRVARSEKPWGPFVDLAGLTDPRVCPFAIDPHPFRDRDGAWYLFHARDFLNDVDDEGRPARAGTALVAYALDDMTKLAPTGVTVARARWDWQRFAANRQMYGRVFDWHTLEGPFVVLRDGRYYCFYSGGCWRTDTYGVDYVVADSVLGPYSDAGAEQGPRILRTVPERVMGPGHCSVISDPDVGSHVLVYHAWGPDMTARRLCIDALSFGASGPRSPGPTWAEQTL
jgi:beta-xylosidase